jgi:hypothetical protein
MNRLADNSAGSSGDRLGDRLADNSAGSSGDRLVDWFRARFGDRLVDWFREYWIVLFFTFTKLLVHLLTATNYGLQRDAYLYLAQSGHLDWGYFSTPPLLAFMIRVHTFIWGDSLLAIRLLPALAGCTGIFLVGWLIRQLKGGWFAQVTGLTAYLLSPAFLRPAVLLQPVIFNHLFWLLAVVVVFRMIKRQDPRHILWMIPVIGLGWLNKYSIVFYGTALLASLIISRNRKLLWNHYLPLALAGGLLVILPNLIWQHQHHWPVITHMRELQEQQLGNVRPVDFIASQIFMHLPAVPVWLGGLIWLVYNREHRRYRVFAWAFALTLLLIILLRGKFYYTIAAYTILVTFGGIAWERWSRRSHWLLGAAGLAMVIVTGVMALPFSLPVYPPEKMAAYGREQIERGFEAIFKWEDGRVHPLPQDYADMVGWEELGTMVWEFYDSLPEQVRSSTLVYGENYGHAGALRYHRPDPSYPEPYSFSDAFMQWAPRNPCARHVIYAGYSDRLPSYFRELKLVGKVENPWFREQGLPVHFGSHPTSKLYEDWEQAWQETRGRFSRKAGD